jgi:HSP20 family molecular chaperone IbpA
MAFPRFFANEFAPVFRLMDELAPQMARNEAAIRQSARSFSPRFDMREHKDNYELTGELPGIDQKNIELSFNDQVLTIRGRTERYHEEGTRPDQIEGGAEQGKLTEGGEANNKAAHRATVEDEGAESSNTQTDVATTNQNGNNQQVGQHAGPRYWVSERHIGSFARTFAFPTRVDEDNVKASLKNGILSVIVPKQAAPASKKISIE